MISSEYISDRLDYQAARSGFCIRVVNYEHNRGGLETLAHIRWEDLAVLFYHDASPVTRRDLLEWEISVYQLYRDALLSSENLAPAVLLPMRRILGLPEEPQDGETDMYVLSSRQARYGASVMLYPQVLERIARGLGDDLYVLPSSVHELILLRARDFGDEQALTAMIREINRTEVLPGEVLSDSLYRYFLAEDALRRVELPV